jgi:nifR3 family TIM-barrel protein
MGIKSITNSDKKHLTHFWKELKKPIFALAPMADVTDCAFRQIIAKYGKPDIFWTEFVSADGLAHPLAREKLLIDLKYGENERPIVAQIFGANPENIRRASALCRELGFDGIDINMGCPDKTIEKQGSCAALIKNPALAREIIRAAKEGGGGLPISVKTRIGYNKNEIETWIRELLNEDITALTIHLRTRKEMSDVPAHWELMKRIVEIRDEMSPHRRPAEKAGKTLILGNGDALNLDDAKQKILETGCDGVMLGRAIFGNPWLFSGRVPTIEEKLNVMIEHTKLFEKMLGTHKNFAIMKKHFKAYVNGFDGAKELRMKLMESENAEQVEEIVSDFLAKIC